MGPPSGRPVGGGNAEAEAEAGTGANAAGATVGAAGGGTNRRPGSGIRLIVGRPVVPPPASRIRNGVRGHCCSTSTDASSAANSTAVGGRLALSFDMACTSRSDSEPGACVLTSGCTGSRRIRRITDAGDSPS